MLTAGGDARRPLTTMSASSYMLEHNSATVVQRGNLPHTRAFAKKSDEKTTPMRTTIRSALFTACTLAALGACAQQPPAAEVTLARLDCGTGTNDQRRFGDAFQYSNPSVPFTFSCYVIRHGSDVMVWDTG